MATVDKKGRPHNIDAFRSCVELNLFAPFAVASNVAAQMSSQTAREDNERGVIINVASVAAFDGQNGQVAYSAMKAAILNMMAPTLWYWVLFIAALIKPYS